MTPLSVQVHTDQASVPRAQWESLAYPSAYLRYDWLRGRSASIRGRPRFLSATTEGRAVLATPGYLTDRSAHPGYHPAGFLDDELPEEEIAAEPGGSAALETLRSWLASTALDQAFVLGAPGRAGGVGYATGLSSEQRRHAIRTVAAEVERQAEAAGAGTVGWVYLVEGADSDLDSVLVERGYAKVTTGADCYLPIPRTAFDEYLNAFSSGRRSSIRREIKKCSQAGVTFDMHGPEILGPELAELELSWRHKYGRRAMLTDTIAEYAQLREHVGDALRVLVAWHQGRPIGFMTFIEDDTVWWGRFPGFDYEIAHQVGLYFNLLFYVPVQMAVDRGITMIDYSMGSYETKNSRGCRLRPFLAYVQVDDDGVREALEVIDRVQRRRFAAIDTMHTTRATV